MKKVGVVPIPAFREDLSPWEHLQQLHPLQGRKNTVLDLAMDVIWIHQNSIKIKLNYRVWEKIKK